MSQHTRLAVVSATHAGEVLIVDGKEVGGVGVDGRQQYVIAYHNTGGYLTCGCPAWIFQGWKKKGLKHPAPCKHLKAYLAQKEGKVVVNGATIRMEY
jgi:hypothetical protein